MALKVFPPASEKCTVSKPSTVYGLKGGEGEVGEGGGGERGGGGGGWEKCNVGKILIVTALPSTVVPSESEQCTVSKPSTVKRSTGFFPVGEDKCTVSKAL